MVTRSSAATPQDGRSPIEPSQSSIARDLAERAGTAMDEAHEMPPGDERAEAIRKATVLRNAADIQQQLGGKRRVPAV